MEHLIIGGDSLMIELQYHHQRIIGKLIRCDDGLINDGSQDEIVLYRDEEPIRSYGYSRFAVKSCGCFQITTDVLYIHGADTLSDERSGGLRREQWSSSEGMSESMYETFKNCVVKAFRSINEDSFIIVNVHSKEPWLG